MALKTFPVNQFWSRECGMFQRVQFKNFLGATSSPGPSPRSKWQLEKPLAKAAEILHKLWSILSCDTWWNGFFTGCFQRVTAVCFLQMETVTQTKQRHFVLFAWWNSIQFWSHFGSLGQGFLWLPFWTWRRPWGQGCLGSMSLPPPTPYKSSRLWDLHSLVSPMNPVL